jgi:thioredoxin reductase (NADPH)
MQADVIILGGGIAGLSAAIYLGRATRKTVVIDSGKSMARWEAEVQNYLGFPQGISGKELLKRGREQAVRYKVKFLKDEVRSACRRNGNFVLRTGRRSFTGKYLLLATGIFHVPPDINGVRACLGHSMFFCKDCDGMQVRGQDIAIYGANTDAAEYALAMRAYSPSIAIVTDGRKPAWSSFYARCIRRQKIPVYHQPIRRAVRRGCQIKKLIFQEGQSLPVTALFTTRGDVYHNDFAKMLGAKIENGAVQVDSGMRTTVKGLYAAGCVTPANCQMIIAAGQGATAAQSINRELFERALRLPRGERPMR